MPLTPFEDLPEDSRHAPIPDNVPDMLRMIDAAALAVGTQEAIAISGSALTKLAGLDTATRLSSQLGVIAGAGEVSRLAGALKALEPTNPLGDFSVTNKMTGMADGLSLGAAAITAEMMRPDPIVVHALPKPPKWKGDADRTARGQAEYLSKLNAVMEQQAAAVTQQLELMRQERAAAEKDRAESAKATRRALRMTRISMWIAAAGVAVTVVLGIHWG